MCYHVSSTGYNGYFNKISKYTSQSCFLNMCLHNILSIFEKKNYLAVFIKFQLSPGEITKCIASTENLYLVQTVSDSVLKTQTQHFFFKLASEAQELQTSQIYCLGDATLYIHLTFTATQDRPDPQK